MCRDDALEPRSGLVPSDLRCLVAEIDNLRKKLHKTADGAYVGVGDCVYFPADEMFNNEVTRWSVEGCLVNGGHDGFPKVADCYSTKELAGTVVRGGS